MVGNHDRVAFCGFFPYENPKYTMIVVISDPQGPYGPAATSGQVLKNMALKMYSRGMFDNRSDINDQRVTGSKPTLYATTKPQRASIVGNDLNLKEATRMHTPADTAAGTVPDVRGIGIREALVRLEEAGLTVGFSGTGYVTSINPPAGTKVKPGTKVHATLSQN